MTTYQIKDDNDIRQYFTMLPNIVDNMNLSVYAFRLYVHIRRVAGEGGTCYQGVRSMAQICNMSIGSITNAKKELVERGLIKIEETVSQNNNPIHLITIVNIWNINKPASSSEQACSPDEQGCSPDELINNPIKNINTSKAKAFDSDSLIPPDEIEAEPDKPEAWLEKDILTVYSRKRRLNSIQRSIVVEIESKYTPAVIKEWLSWAVVTEIPLGKALASSAKTLAGWGKSKNGGKSKVRGSTILDPGEYSVTYSADNLAKDKVYQQLFGV